MKVRATKAYQELNLTDKELGIVPLEGQEWEVTEERYKVLAGDNGFKRVFATEVKEKPVKETATKKVVDKKKAVK